MWIYLEAYSINPNNVFKSQVMYFFKMFFLYTFFFQNGNSFKKLVSICKMSSEFLMFIAKIMFNSIKFQFSFKLRLPLEEPLDFVLRS